MNNPTLNSMLKWGIKNSEPPLNNSPSAPQPLSASDREAFDQIVNGPSDAKLMKQSIAIIENKDAPLELRETEFEDFEMLIQGLDNANNLEPLNLWAPLIKQLESEDASMRQWAAHCCGTAVQNNIRTQERLLIVGGLPSLVRLATEDTDLDVRKRATTALSSAVRNFQPALDAVVSHMPAKFKPQEKLDASDMESVDILINKLRESL